MTRSEIKNKLAPDKILDRVFLLDLDRHLVDTDLIAEMFGRIAKQKLGIDADIAREKATIESRGDTFDIFGFVRKIAIEKDVRAWNEFQQELADRSYQGNILMPGAKELIELLQARGEYFIIFTFPVGDPAWQRLKVVVANLGGYPLWLTTTTEKGAQLTKLYSKEKGYFTLPTETGDVKTKAVILCDDKANSFGDDFPPLPSRGYWVVKPENALKTQRGRVPSNVRHTRDLYEVIELENRPNRF